jgi:hypothetical protein
MKPKNQIMPLALLAFLMLFGTAKATNLDLPGRVKHLNLSGISKMYSLKKHAISFPGITTLYAPVKKKANDPGDLENLYMYVSDGYSYNYTIQFGNTIINTDASMFSGGFGLIGQVPEGTYEMLVTCNDGYFIACQADFYNYAGSDGAVYMSESNPQGRVYGVTIDGPSDGNATDNEIDIEPFD